jgi:ribosomal protein L37AE/L43A
VALSGRLLPLHLKPRPDEQLSSWLVRLAHVHGVPFSSLCWHLWPQRAWWNRDIDRMCDGPMLKAVAERTATPYERVLETTLRAYEGKVVARFSPATAPLWLLPPALLYRVRSFHRFQFCRGCLAADTTPYFRRRWRLAFTTVCLDHYYRLLDACPHCDTPVTLRRSPMTIPCSWRCHHCHGHLATGARPPAVADPTVVAFQRTLMEGLEYGAMKVGNHMMDPLTFFAGLHLLWKVRAPEAIAKLQGITLRSHWLYDPEKHPERLRIDIRYETMRLLCEVLVEHPEQFRMLCQAMQPGSEKPSRHLFPPAAGYWDLVLWHLDASHPVAPRSQ